MYKLFMLALSVSMLSASPLLLAADSEDIHDLSAQSDNQNTDIRAEPQLDTGSPNPKSLGRTGRALPGTTDRATNKQGGTPMGNNGTVNPGVTDRASNLSTDSVPGDNVARDANPASDNISNRLERTNSEARERNNRINGSSNPATRVPASSARRSSSAALPPGQTSADGSVTSGTGNSANGDVSSGNGSSTAGTGNAGTTGNSSTSTFSAPRKGKR